MRLEKVDLVLMFRTRRVLIAPLHTKMVEYFALVDRCFGLGNQFRPPHVAVPLRGWRDGDLDTLFAFCVCWVLESWRQVDVLV